MFVTATLYVDPFHCSFRPVASFVSSAPSITRKSVSVCFLFEFGFAVSAETARILIAPDAIVSYSIAVVVMFIMTISGNTTIPTPNLTLAQQASISNNALGGIGTTGQNLS